MRQAWLKIRVYSLLEDMSHRVWNLHVLAKKESTFILFWLRWFYDYDPMISYKTMSSGQFTYINKTEFAAVGLFWEDWGLNISILDGWRNLKYYIKGF